MEIKVREINVEEKGSQQVEKELLEKHEASLENNQEELKAEENNENVNENENQDPIQLKDEDVLSFIGKRYNKQINSLDELMAAREEEGPLPEDVASFLKYKKETGRSIDDFIKLNKDYDAMDEDSLLKSYIQSTEEGLDDDDVEVLMEEYAYDEDLDTDSEVKKKKLIKKKAVAEAKKFFEEQKSKYTTRLESSQTGLLPEEEEDFKAYKQYISKSKDVETENKRKSEWFSKKTEELFSAEFKGFEFELNNKKFNYTPAEAAELKKNQSNPFNFINKYLDESGMIKDAVGYHKSLAIAMNPEKFAKFFYEQGMADSVNDLDKRIKNVNMSERRSPEAMNKGGMQIRSVDNDSGRGLKIKSIKKI